MIVMIKVQWKINKKIDALSFTIQGKVMNHTQKRNTKVELCEWEGPLKKDIKSNFIDKKIN